MSKIEKKYEQHAVKICSNGIDGSGCIIQPANSKYTLVFTAKHCLTDNDKVEKNTIKITGSLGNEETSFVVEKVFLDDEFDVAIIQVSRILTIETSYFTKPIKELPVYLFGFPHLLKGESQILSCKISFDRDNHSEIELFKSPTTFEKSSSDTIKGFSGSGVFYEINGSVSVVGILTRLKAPDGAYDNICMHSIQIFDNLLKSNGLQSLLEDDISDIIQDYSFSFTNYNSESEKHYLQRTVDNQFNKILLSPKSIWISGESGVGKTLLINRNLKISSKNYIPIDLTTSSLDDIDEYFKIINGEIINQKFIKSSSKFDNIYDDIAFNLTQISNTESLYLYVDEVPIKDHNIFSKFLSGFIKISEKYANISDGKNQIKWIIATRINPDAFIKNLDDCLINKQKAIKHFVFKPLNYWSNDEMIFLIDLLGANLNFCFSSSTKTKMIEISKGIPNPIKRVIELILIDNCTIENAIEIVKTEHI